MEVIGDLMFVAFLVLVIDHFSPLFIGERLPFRDIVFIYLLSVLVFMILTYSPIIKIDANISFEYNKGR